MTEHLTKPCLCGCGRVIICGVTCKPFRFGIQRFATLSCSMRWRNIHDQTVIEGRRKGAKALKAAGYAPSDDDPSLLVTDPGWLDLPPVRIRLQRQAEGIKL